MTCRCFPRFFIGSLSLLTILALTACGQPETTSPPNVLLVVVDTLRADHLTPYGYEVHPTTPVLQKLVDEEDAMVVQGMLGSSSWTKPGVATLFTGLDGKDHGVMRLVGPGSRLDDPHSLASEFKKAGYATGCVMSNFLLSKRMGAKFDVGFDLYDDTTANLPDPHRGSSAEQVTNAGLAWMEQQGTTPWLMVLHYFDPHASFEDHPHVDWLDPAYRGWVIGGASTDLLRQKEKSLSEVDRTALSAFYDEEIHAVDAQVGRVVAQLKASGQWENTVVVFTSDHGEELGERGHIGHTQSLRSELVDLPCVVRVPSAYREDWQLPESEGGGYAMRQLYPAMLEVAGLQPPAGRGVEAPTSVTTQVDFVPVRKDHVEKYVQKRGLRKDGLYYILDLRSGEELLFDLAADPLTDHPLPAEHAGWEGMRKAYTAAQWWEAP